jgi:hypothetical protein
LAGGVAAVFLAKVRAETGSAPVVVELFTSQGCGSCPLADRFLGELSRQPGIIALSLNVDYWDYLGWRDTLGNPDCTQRQRAYANRLGIGTLFTPQMVINGSKSVTGADRRSVLESIARQAFHNRGNSIPTAVAVHGSELSIEVAGSSDASLRQFCTIWAMTIFPEVEVHISRGENAGRTVVYNNVVRRTLPVGTWHGEALHIRLPISELMHDGVTGCAALVQVEGSGPIIGAASFASSTR